MKHFRLLACLAIIATFTSVFATWELENYAESYKDEAGLDVTLVTNIEDKEALIVEITNTEMPTVVFDAGEADVSGDVNVKVTTNIADEDLSKYNYYYVVFSDAQLVSKVPGLTEYVPNTDGVEFPATSAMTVLEVGEDGIAVISAETLETILAPDVEVSETSLNQFSNDVIAVTEIMSEKGLDGAIGILVYAEKAPELECGEIGHTTAGTCPACGAVKSIDINQGSDIEVGDHTGDGGDAEIVD